MPIINVVIDISHHNGNVNLNRARDDGILGVIQKASQGQSNRDPTYKTNRKKANDAGLLWGAYHFATGSNGVHQAENFLEAVGDLAGVLLVLDFEPNPTGPSMSLEEARAFVTHVRLHTGKTIGFYSGHYIKQLLGSGKDPILAECWFWLAQFGPTPVVPPNWGDLDHVAIYRRCVRAGATSSERRRPLRPRQVQRLRTAVEATLVVSPRRETVSAAHCRVLDFCQCKTARTNPPSRPLP